MLFPPLQRNIGLLVVAIVTICIYNIHTPHTNIALERQGVNKDMIAIEMINKAEKSIVEMKEGKNMGHKTKPSSTNIGEFGVGTGLLLMPDLKIAICLIPKVASITWKFIALRLLGNDPKDVCGCKQKDLGCMAGALLWNRKVSELSKESRKVWKKSKWAKHVDAEELAEIMSPHSDWVTITTLRNPWKRFISAFWQDNGARTMGKVNATMFLNGDKSCKIQKLFKKYLSAPTKKPLWNETPHSRSQTKYCGLSHFDYDHVLDLDDYFHELESILAPYNDLMTTGWESCMVNGSGSFYNDKIDSPHHSLGSSSFWTNQICTDDIYTSFRSKYKNDIELYNKYFPEREVNCVVKNDTCSDVLK